MKKIVISIIVVIFIICAIFYCVEWTNNKDLTCVQIYKILDSDEKKYNYQNRMNYINNFYNTSKNLKCERLENLDRNYFLARIHTDWGDYLYETKDGFAKADYHHKKAGEYFATSSSKFNFSSNSNHLTDSQYWDFFLSNSGKTEKNFEEEINKINFYYDNYHQKKCNHFAHLDRNCFLSELYQNWAKVESFNNINKAIELQKKSINYLETSNAEYYKRNNSNNKYYMIAPKYLQLNNYYFKNKQYSEALISIDFASTNLLKAGGDPSWFESNRCKVYWAMGYEGSAKTYCEYAYKVLSKLIYKHKKFNAKKDDDLINEYNIVNSIYRQIQNRNDLAMQYSVNRNNNDDVENEGFNCSKCYPKDKLSEEFKQTDEFIEGCSDCYYYAEHQK